MINTDNTSHVDDDDDDYFTIELYHHCAIGLLARATCNINNNNSFVALHGLFVFAFCNVGN